MQLKKELKNKKEFVSPMDKAINFIRAYLPEEYRTMSFYEIARLHDNEKNIDGVSLLGDAFSDALAAATGTGSDRYEFDQEDPSGRYLTYNLDEENVKILLDIASLSSGSGYFDNQLQSVMTGFDKYGKSLVTPNMEYPGLVFFSRPRLCLQSPNLRSNPTMVMLDSSNPKNISFAIRALLDTNLAGKNSFHSAKYSQAIADSPFINSESPWLTPLTNTLKTFDGLPNLEVMTETTTGGYFSEAQSYVVGGHNFSEGSYSVNCTFRELPGGIIFALFFYWMEYMRCVTRGEMLAYADDIDHLIMNYTVSIYMFMMDPSMTHITRWVKCTGCFPKTLNVGSVFTKSEEDGPSQEAKTVNVSFVVNKIEYMKPECLLEFNTLAARYCPDIDKQGDSSRSDYVQWQYNQRNFVTGSMSRENIPINAFSNFCGLPYIQSDNNGYRLVFRRSKKDLYADPAIKRLIAYDLMNKEQEWNDIAKAKEYLSNNYNVFNLKTPMAEEARLEGLSSITLNDIVERIRFGDYSQDINDRIEELREEASFDED